jgi:hypothetical protein
MNIGYWYNRILVAVVKALRMRMLCASDQVMSESCTSMVL